MNAQDVRHYRREDLVLMPDVDGARFWAVALDHALLTYFEVDAHCTFPAHQHESEQITHVLEGELYFVVNDVEHRVAAGEVIAIPSQVPHAVCTRECRARAVDAWSPVLPAYRPNAGAQPAAANPLPGVAHER